MRANRSPGSFLRAGGTAMRSAGVSAGPNLPRNIGRTTQRQWQHASVKSRASGRSEVIEKQESERCGCQPESKERCLPPFHWKRSRPETWVTLPTCARKAIGTESTQPQVEMSYGLQRSRERAA